MPSTEGLALLSTRALEVSVGGRVLVRGLHVAIGAGRLVAVMGPNGVGKTMLLHTLAGLRPAAAGHIELQGHHHAAWGKRRLAQFMALMPQDIEDPFPVTVLDAVLLGRHPHIASWRWESETDYAIARAALAAVGLTGYDDRDVLHLSGGERRRVALAAVLAQQPKLFLLDEPINHLDPAHQLDALALLRREADAGAGVMVCLHDPTLAARYADEALLLYRSGDWRFGHCEQMLTAENLSELYGTALRRLVHEGRTLFFSA